MTKRDFAFIAVRILALYVLVQALMLLSYVCESIVNIVTYTIAIGLNEEDFVDFVRNRGISFFVYLLTAYVFWIKAEAIARRITPQESPSQEVPASAGGFDREKIISVGAVILGLYLITTPLSNIGSRIYLALFVKNMSVWIIQEIIFCSIGIALALWLIFGSRGIARFICNIRTFGVSTQSHNGQVPDASGGAVPVQKNEIKLFKIIIVIVCVIVLIIISAAVYHWAQEHIVRSPF